ncbi:hypothetical protein CK203_001359 [Vitis vinifera]|uniref:Reverse transcriptase domain-containing protein n=1 Tax=Vitis vinifera TaxID=29760 RepID=A0A438KM68_VITVI|nr:hypothetical protein CK203_001359 [Vitis vinifera]
MVHAHRRRNWLAKVKVNGCWLIEENEIRDSVAGSFQNLLTEEGEWRPNIGGLTFERLGGYSRLKCSECGVLCKLDIEKHEEFETKGPLSPYLFVIAREAFSCLLKKVENGGYLSRLDDLFEFVTYVVRGNLWVRINLDKSELILVGRMDNIDDLALDLGCKIGDLPFSYLGLSSGAFFKFVTVWDGWKKGFAKGALWKQVISQKYGEDEEGWRSHEVGGRYGVGLWKIIRKESDLLNNIISFFVEMDAWVVDVWNFKGKRGGWTPCFFRLFNDWSIIEGMVGPNVWNFEGKRSGKSGALFG